MSVWILLLTASGAVFSFWKKSAIALVISLTVAVLSYLLREQVPQVKGVVAVEKELKSLPKGASVRFRVRNECGPCQSWAVEQVNTLRKQGVQVFPSPTLIGSEIAPDSGAHLIRENLSQFVVVVG